MKRKTTRLTFTEEELANPNVRRAAKKATRAADRADKAKAKLSPRAPPKRGLKMDADKAKERSAQLRFGKAEFGEEIARPKRRKPGAEALLGGEAHCQIDKQNQDENAGVQAAHEGERLAEGAAKKLKDGKYSKKLKAYKKAEKLDKVADKANIQALRRKQQAAQPASNPISRWKQRQQIKASYYARKTGSKISGSAANTARSAATKKAKAVAAKAAQFASTHAHMLLMGGVLVLLIMVIFCFITSCSVFFPGGMGTVWTTSYTAEDEDILGAETDYQALEEALRAEVAAIPSSYPDYDEYTWDLAPITHDPHELAAVLTAIHEAYTRGEVQGTMQSIFDAQYEIILTETIEIRTRTETRTGTDPTTGDTYTYEVEVQYEWRILNITLLNFGIDSVARGM
ncbi:MAG TPA: NlpC/P60 family protein, partial [Candidatus Fournierella merdigallinarum]|nr:NlpC/P60 family protein [Candidatus Fournierella merdigallinarum]